MELRVRGQGSHFPSWLALPLPRILVACQVLPGSGGRSTASEWNVPFLVQGPVSRGAQRSFETTNMLLFFKLPFICCSRSTAGRASVKFTPLNLLHLHYDSMNMTPTGTGECTTTQRTGLHCTARVLNRCLRYYRVISAINCFPDCAAFSLSAQR